MSAINDGGAAFPVIPPYAPEGQSAAGYPYPDAGMTLRDYFAAKAMQQAFGELMRLPKDSRPLSADMPRVADLAYLMADAMLAARSV
jgi:hypothetical protein